MNCLKMRYETIDNLPGMFYAEVALFNYLFVAEAGCYVVISGVPAFFCSCSSDICLFLLFDSDDLLTTLLLCANWAIANKINKFL